VVIGNGLSGMVAARALASVGIHATVVGVREEDSRLYSPHGSASRAEWIESLSQPTDGVELLDLENLPRVERDGYGFSADFGHLGLRRYGCLVLTGAAALKPLGANLPERVGIVTPEALAGIPERIGFLLDYGLRSDPSTAMTALQQAVENNAAGGSSFVVFRHAPVAHLFGESLYDSAKSRGVQFYRFGEILPSIESLAGDGGQARGFRITFQDVIEQGESLILDCDRILAAQAPDPSSISRHLLRWIGEDVDGEGFLLTDSIHCHSGRSFRNGIYAVGEVTGELDLIRVSAQAAAAAAKARAWMMRASRREGTETAAFTDQCVRCLTCYRICPHDAISFAGEPARSKFHAVGPICEECGICASACPRNVIDLVSSSEKGVEELLARVAETRHDNPLVVYGCRRSAGRLAAEMELPRAVRFFPVPCAGRVSEAMLWETMASGARGVLVVGCHHGNCASHTGTDWAARRVSVVAEGLAQIGWPGTVSMARVAANEPARFGRIIEAFGRSTGKKD